ncbi:hypothetical protein DICPUDRAFT_152352 [Dictyostelium purpureum]|uniref:Uncharacterized protein n=1 Tax=Dictyostelium purpureum TaxID=5786 RepID=F0ZL51_DICPU|nr:uncharacterized protein DICPUDRAFT_152352 [Dictyostelium purpureum]EGC35331.1 hypothetical protein DICPUDRAFT_152352 [Dictyostelium purpureum]|eukprot:XP_003288138.1 hypothetical protein DICPUDRAFT_152352 [Dictyostelium purpureum]
MSDEKEVKRMKCIHCENGRAKCFHCKGSGRTVTRFDCFHCKGQGNTVCDWCHGTMIVEYTGCGCTIL